MTAREADAEARLDLERDYLDASREASRHPAPPALRAADWKGPHHDGLDARTAAASDDLHLVRTPAASGGVREGDRDQDVAAPPRRAARRDDRMPVHFGEVDPRRPLTPTELAAIEQRAQGNRPVSRVEVRRLCVTIHALTLKLAKAQR